MEKFYIPYKSNKPAWTYVNGHRLIIVSTDSETFSGEGFDDVDSVQELECDMADIESTIAALQEDLIETGESGGVVIAPTDIDPDELLESLSRELPWIQ